MIIKKLLSTHKPPQSSVSLYWFSPPLLITTINKAIGGSGVFFACWAHIKVLLHTELALFTVC